MYKRNPNEIYINPCCLKMLGLHKENMDIQFIFDPFSCAHYIVNYINKSDRCLSQLLHDAVIEVKKGNKSIRESLRAVGNVLMNASEISAQEAVYSLIHLPMTKASEADIILYINTSPPNERVHILKSKKYYKIYILTLQKFFVLV